MYLTLVTPEKKLLTDLEVDEVIVPADRGELDILPGHVPLMSTLHSGSLRYREKGSDELKQVCISWGYLEVCPSGVNVLADTAEMPEEIDPDRAKKALELAHKRLADAGLAPEEVVKFQRKQRRARARLDANK